MTIQELLNVYNEEVPPEEKKITKKEFLNALKYACVVDEVLTQIYYLRQADK